MMTILILSAIAFWCLMMPANLYGIIGIPVSAFIFYKAASEADKPKRHAWNIRHCVYVMVVALLYWVLVNNFYKRWIISGMVMKIAGMLGTSASFLLILGGVLLAVLSIPAVLFLYRWMTRISFSQAGEGIKPQFEDILFCLLIALCYAFLLSLQPWSDGYPGSDSTVFLYIGQQMRKGLVPYKDLFDHKGIILFWIEYLGRLLTPESFTGVWIIEICNLFATAVIILWIARLFTDRKLTQYLSIVGVLATFHGYLAYEGGNLVEEYALPWITLALYVFLKFFMHESYKFCDIIWLGISFCVVLFLRVNMVTVWAAFLPVVIIMFLRKKQWKDIGRCILAFSIGCGIVLGIILVYCVRTGCLEDMLKYYIQFNLGYSESESSLWSNIQSAWFLITLSFISLMVMLAVTLKLWKNRIIRLNLWYGAVSVLFASMSGRLYYHYGLVLIPVLIVPMIVLLSNLPEWNWNKAKKIIWGVASVALVLRGGSTILTYREVAQTEVAAYIEEYSQQTDNVLIIGNTCSGYLQSGRTTTNRFFYQTPPINISDELYQEFVEELTADTPDLIVMIGEKSDLAAAGNHLSDICEMLDTMREDGIYVLEEQNGFFTYKLSE